MASSATTQSTTAGAKSSLPKEKQLLELPGVKVKASSMLNDDEDTYGPMNLLDGKAETCWNSDQVRNCLSNFELACAQSYYTGHKAVGGVPFQASGVPIQYLSDIPGWICC